MDFHGHRRYHPYTPPVDAHRGRNQPFPNGQTGAWNGRYSSVHRGLGSQRSLTRGMFHHPPEHSSVSTNKTPFYPRYPGPQPRLSWFQGRSMHYGVPRPPTNYYSEQRERNFRWPSYRAARYGPYPRLHPKHIGIASSRSTGQTNEQRNTTSESPHKIKPGTRLISSCSQQTNVSTAQEQKNLNSSVTGEVVSLDKKRATSDGKTPSVAKVVPFSHQPSVSAVKCSASTCCSSATPTVSAATNTQIQQSVAHEQNSMLQTSVDISESQCPAPDGGMMTVFAHFEDGQVRPIMRTICSCQLRKRALKYADKGKTKTDSIVLDSDEEEEKNSAAAGSVGDQEAGKPLSSSTSAGDKLSGKGEGNVQDTPRKRAKMSIENPEKRSSSDENSPQTMMEMDVSSSVICSESVADSVARIVDGLRHSVGEGNSSCASSDSLSSLSFASITEDAPLLANPQILRRILDECNGIDKPFKKLKVSPMNLYTAAKDCNVHKVLALLVGGCDPNQQVVKAKGKTAMHAAAGGGYVDIMACLRLAGCDLNLVDYENRTPFFDAVSNHKVQAVEYLIECGANVRVRDSKGMTCFHLAVRQGHTDLIKLLLKTGQFDINEKDDGGWTPIMWAAEDKQYEATQLLMECGANVHSRDLELNVPLHWAAFSGSAEVCKLLLSNHVNINTVNEHLETALHIAARDNHYQCVQLFLSRGADIHIRNKDGNTPAMVADPDSRGYSLLKAKEDLESRQHYIRPRILHCDISRGQENVSISCINEVDDEPFPEFTFIKECFETKRGMIDWSISRYEGGCSCERVCQSGMLCLCSKRSERQRLWYEEGLVKTFIKNIDRPLVYECNRMCNCWTYCKNRVVQKGMQYPLQLYRTLRKAVSRKVVGKNVHATILKGWGVRSLAKIPRGSFVCEYTGELISDSEADARDDDCYLFDLDCKESSNENELFCIDAKYFGNISRFINHSCEPNIFPLRVFVNHTDIRFPRIAFFAIEDIDVHEEICFNYGDKFWSVKKKEFYCECGTTSCKYPKPNS